MAEFHRRASLWYEDNGIYIEAFHQDATANDVERAERLIEKAGMLLHFHGAVAPVLNWLESLPRTVLDTRPSLWIMDAWALLFVGQITTTKQKLHAAEAALQGTEPDDRTRDLVGRIASMRAALAVMQHDVATIVVQSRRALQYLHPDNPPVRIAAPRTLRYASQLQGDRAAARRAYIDGL